MRFLRLTIFSLVIFALSITLIAPTGVAAQQTTTCFKLTAANCKIFTTALTNITKLSTFQPTIDLTLNIRFND